MTKARSRLPPVKKSLYARASVALCSLYIDMYIRVWLLDALERDITYIVSSLYRYTRLITYVF